MYESFQVIEKIIPIRIQLTKEHILNMSVYYKEILMAEILKSFI